MYIYIYYIYRYIIYIHQNSENQKWGTLLTGLLVACFLDLILEALTRRKFLFLC